MVIGCGQCGGRIADEFARLNRRAHLQRGLEIITGAFAINTDIADLSGLTTIEPDYRHRILIGGRTTSGRGVGKINELGAEVAREDADIIMDAIRTARRFPETDAFLLIAGAAGGTGSGAIPILTQQLKEQYFEKPLYNLIVLPFRHEERTEARAIYNSATCLKSAYSVADAIFLIDNQRYIKKKSSIASNLANINALAVAPFYNLLCAGEEKKPKYIGSRVVDAGDIIQTLVGWTVIGSGKSQIPRIRFPLKLKRHFTKKATESQRGVQATDEAIGWLSLKCNPIDSKRALYLLSAPSEEMNMEMIREIGTHLRKMAPEAVIRGGDYPREKGSLEVTIILSELYDVGKVMDYFARTLELIHAAKGDQEAIERERRGIEVDFKDIPSLL
ncbi:MAG: cell division protein FtsZ [Dehalococcoidia bacterium]|nr:MAG: cell division protein FtsZ [Dehalococcoidia bacterium]